MKGVRPRTLELIDRRSNNLLTFNANSLLAFAGFFYIMSQKNAAVS